MNGDYRIRYFDASQGWCRYEISKDGRLLVGAELRSLAAAEKDAQATVRRLKAEAENNVKEEANVSEG